MVRHLIHWALAASVLATSATHAQTAASYPSKTVRIVVPYPAGGPVDAAARQVARGLAEQFGQAVVVDNKPGASSSLGAAEVAKSAADGHTLLFTLPDSFTYLPRLFKNLPYDPLKDFAPITQVASTPPVLVLRNDAGVASIKDLGPKSPPISFGTWGSGTYPHLIAAALAQKTRANMTIVGYRGGAPAVQDFMGGHIQMTIAGVPAALDIQAKGLGKIVAVGGGQRSAALPDVPTYAELGFTEGTFSVPSWVALAAPAGTPVEVVNKVRDGVVKVLAEKPMQDFLARFGWSAMGNTPAQFKAALERETPLIAEAMRTAGVQAE